MKYIMKMKGGEKGLTMDTSEALDDDDSSSQVPGLQGSMFTAASLPIVLFTDDTPRGALSLETASHTCTCNWGNVCTLNNDNLLMHVPYSV